jgi:hypothetical protein
LFLLNKQELKISYCSSKLLCDIIKSLKIKSLKMNEKTKNFLKLLGILVSIFFLVSIFNFLNPDKRTSSSIIKNNFVEDNIGLDYSSAPERTGARIQSESMPAQNFSKNDGENFNVIDKKIIKNGDLNLKVDKVQKAVDEITKIVENQQGEVFATNFYERIKGQKNGFMTVKIPVEKFSQTLNEIKTVASQVLSESTTGQDVTERYTDLQARLKNKKAEEESFVKILDQAVKIEDVLSVTRELSRVRGEIESLEGQIKLMDSQTEMSTITINLSEDAEIGSTKDDWRPWQIIKESFNELIDNSQEFVNNLIRFVIVGIPSILTFLTSIGIVYWIGKKVWNKFRK